MTRDPTDCDQDAPAVAASSTAEAWLARYHAGKRDVLDVCYREHFDAVWQAVGRVLSGMDQESVVHEVFFRVLFVEDVRRKFRGGSFSSWLGTVARNQALDFQRRAMRERPLDEAPMQATPPVSEEELDFAHFVEEFRREHLPAKWLPVFETRFIRQLSQREAARALGIHRTTLVYQEIQVRRLLKKVLLHARSMP